MWNGEQTADGLEVGNRIIFHRHDVLVGGVCAGVAKKQRIAVRLGVFGMDGCNGAACSGSVVNNDRLAGLGCQLLAHRAHDDVGAAARRERHNHRHC